MRILTSIVTFKRKFIGLLNNKNYKNITEIFKHFFTVNTTKTSTDNKEDTDENPVLFFFNSIFYKQLILHQYTFEIIDANLSKVKQSNSYSTEARMFIYIKSFEDLKYFNFIGNVFFFVGILTIKPLVQFLKSKNHIRKFHTYFIQVLNFKKKCKNFLRIMYNFII